PAPHPLTTPTRGTEPPAMPAAEEIDGDVYVSPVYLAGSTYTGDPALRPLLDVGFTMVDDDLANAYLASPDQKVRVGWLPEGEDDCLWRITGHERPFAPPRWLATFDHFTPVEVVAAFTTALAEDHAQGNHASVHGHPVPQGRSPSSLWPRQAGARTTGPT
ncbi:DUF317 domain-containing protein, partial [Streptomyces clavuligerus]